MSVGPRWWRPLIATGDPPSELMTWWALLYGLSILARYHPREWTVALRLDSSPLAVPIIDALDEAFDHLPYLVLVALQPLLLHM